MTTDPKIRAEILFKALCEITMVENKEDALKFLITIQNLPTDENTKAAMKSLVTIIQEWPE